MYPLGEMLSYPKLALRMLDITGNSLGCSGLNALCNVGLQHNENLEVLNISDNNIRPMITIIPSPSSKNNSSEKNTEGKCNDDDSASLEEALKTFSQVLLVHKTLANVDFRCNSIGEELGKLILMPTLLQIKEASFKKICFRNEFASLIDNTSSGKKKRGGKKKR